MVEALVNPELLRWARERVAMTVGMLADRLKIPADKVIAWEEGQARPSFVQAERLAALAHIPFGVLFLASPPDETLPIPDLRTHSGMPRDRFSPDFLDFLRDTMFKRDWYRAFLESRGAELLSFVGSLELATPVDSAAIQIRSALGIDPDLASAGNWETHLNELFRKCEDLGIWIMRTGYVGSNTRRTLSTSDFRGFAIADEIVPLIVINGRDAKAAQAFTLAHELAHIWFGRSGVSDPFLRHSDGGDLDIERVCNAVAAEILVPRVNFDMAWIDTGGLEKNAQALSQRFKVSRVVIARRALDLGKISLSAYQSFFDSEQRGWASASDGGGDYYKIVPVKNGRRFTEAVLGSAMSGNLLLRDAGSLLHMKPATIPKLYARQTQEVR